MTIDDLKPLTYNQVETLFRNGSINKHLWAMYRHLWQTSGPRFAMRACYCNDCQATSPAFEKEERS